MRHFFAIVAIAAAFTASSYLISQASAEEVPVESTSERTQDDGTWLQISPVTKRLTLEPGTIKENSFEIKNTGDSEMKVNIYATPYSTIPGTNNITFESQNNYTKLSGWITFLGDDGEYHEKISLSLSANKSKSITYKITVPKDATGGGQYAGIFAESNPDDSEGVKATTRVCMLIYAKVDGELHAASKIVDINSNILSMDGRIRVSASVKNTGNIDYQASLKMTVSTLFGKELYNDETVSSVLPESTKIIYAEWNSGFNYGLYHLSYTVEALEETIDGSHIVFVLPIGVLIIGIILLAGITLTTIWAIKKQKLKKRVNKV